MSIDQKSYYENNKVKLLLKQKERYEKHIKYKTNFESTQNQICKTCNVDKLINEFAKNKSSPTGFRTICKSCYNDKARKKPYKKRKYTIDRKEYNKLYRIKNIDKIRLYMNNYQKTKLSINSRISLNLRKRLNKCVKSKCIKTFDLLGCNITCFINYLESKFTTGMTWENYGDWHIDHIKPCSSFDLTDIEQQKICFNYTNLQPLWATTEIAISYGEDMSYIGNLEKGNKI